MEGRAVSHPPDGGSFARQDMNEVVAIRELVLSDGSHIRIPTTGVTVVVGANNSGKTTFLSDLVTLVAQGGTSGTRYRLIERIYLELASDAEPVVDWFRERGLSVQSLDAGERLVPVDGRASHSPEDIKELWAGVQHHNQLSHLFGYFVYSATADLRIRNISAINARKSTADHPSHPLHRIQDDVSLLSELNKIVVNTFGV